MGVYNTIDTNDTLGMAQIVLIVILIIIGIAIYIGQAIFLNLFHQKMKESKTWKAWVPIINLYLLGNLTFNSNTAGYTLIVAPIIFILMDKLNIAAMIILGVYIYAIVIYLAIKKEEKDELSPKMVTNEPVKNPFKIKKPKLAKFEKAKEEKEKEEPQQYQSEQPMNINSIKESNQGFHIENKTSSSNDSSLQDLYRK